MQALMKMARARGFVSPGSALYGGFAHTHDYGPAGALLRRNVRSLWWRRHVTSRVDVHAVCLLPRSLPPAMALAHTRNTGKLRN